MTSYGIWVVVVAGATAACGSGSPKSDDSFEQATLRKLEPYEQCHADHSAVVFRTEDLYRRDFADAPPTPDRDVVMIGTPDPAECVQAITAAKALQPPMPDLEAAGAAYASELARVHRLTTTYDRAKAIEVHGELMSAFDAFDRAQAALFDQLYVLNRKIHLVQLARNQTAGDEVRVLMERAQIAAEDLARFAAVPWNQLDKLDLSAIAASVAGLERAVEALNEVERRGPDHAGQLGAFGDVRDPFLELVTVGRQLARRARDNVQYTDAEKLMIREGNEAGVVGTPAAVAHAYNRVAELY